MVIPDYRGRKPGFLVRLLSPLGSYMDQTILEADRAMVISAELCFTVTRIVSDDSFSEIDSLAPYEIPLLGSVLLCVKKDEPRFFPYPAHQSVRLGLPLSTVLTGDIIDEAGRWLVSIIKSKKHGSHWPTDILHRPPVLGGQIPYSLIPSDDLSSDRATVLAYMLTAHPIYLRGVACLLKANMASQHPEFFESALLSLWIALDAAQSIVFNRLREAGNKNPSSAEAAQYVYDAYGFEGVWEKFFEDDYANRIRFIHPENRYGAQARPWGFADDFFELNENLIDLFYFFATDIPRDTQA
ncbi:hypothetical protein [Granulicella sp. L46]|uniref:hypothetical protein n=1 Tax=Granulicella sp. L46 TaxID=1641865 RepID=UPI00131C12C6|nr:hypothetical protein [Granulicella sp. L46]